MTFSFNTNIPAAPNDPSVDQPDMLTNNQSTNLLLAVDHISFNTAGGGQHKQVTFNGNNVPTPPVTPPVLFTNTVAGLPQLFFYSGDATHSSSQYVNNAQGSTFVLGGMIMKWGFFGPISDNQVINFPVAFPNNCYTVVATPVKSGAFGNLVFTIRTTPTVTGFQVRTNGVVLDAISYIAIGN